uniref:MIGE-like protein n=1 Tax=Nucleocytoviricota sp. TaxID=2809609 RepID=A0A9E8G8C3_9VIRU|nr:MIGE-like protein [Nucleocytoviricota sp.]
MNNTEIPTYKFICNICNFKSNNKKDYNNHINTNKHKKLTNTDKISQENNYKCTCGKVYKHRQSLYNHKKVCNYKEEENIKCEIVENNINLEQLVVKLFKENDDIKEIMKKQQDQILKQQQQISELIPKVGNNNNNNINNNQKFNINVFLNEHCKDAMSINDFVQSIEISLKNLLTTKEKGLAHGLNDIINENMNKLSIYERPIHCTDKKRETLYVKNNTWEKDIDKALTTNMLKGLQMQQIKNLQKFKESYPNYESDENLKHEYMILLNKCTKPLIECERKLFKNLCDRIYVKDDEILLKE